MSAGASLSPSWLRGLVVFTLMMLPARALAEPYPTSRPHPHGTATQLLYNAGACAVLVFAGSILKMAGFALWPVALLHAFMAVWCAASLRAEH